MPLAGRGKDYSRTRAASEWILARAYRGGWPARLVRRLGMQPPVRTRTHQVTVERWPAGAPSLRIAFASDIHVGPTTHPSLIDEAIARLHDAAPDVLLLGGDYVYLHAEGFHPVAAKLAKVPAPLGKFAVFGNHDLWADDAALRRALEGAGFKVLVNESAALPAPFDHVSICGLDEPWTGRPDVAKTFAGARDVKVLLMHAPEGLMMVGETYFDVALCGHTHGGHIALRGGIPIVVAGPLSRRYGFDLHDIGGRPLIVSRGIGATESALRVNADPDIRVVTLGRG